MEKEGKIHPVERITGTSGKTLQGSCFIQHPKPSLSPLSYAPSNTRFTDKSHPICHLPWFGVTLKNRESELITRQIHFTFVKFTKSTPKNQGR
jgi:hypothetical protein